MRRFALIECAADRGWDWIWAGMALLAILLSTANYGPGTTPDSAAYLAMGRSWLTEGRWLNYDGTPVTLWPPFYSVAVAVPSFLLQVDWLVAARYFGAACFGVLVFFMSRFARAWVTDRRIGCLTGPLLAVSTPLYLPFASVLSEGLFCLLVAWVLVLIVRDSPSMWEEVAVAVVWALALITRLISVALIPLLLFWVYQVFRREAWPYRHSLRRIVLLGCAVLPLAMWMVRNWWMSGEIAGNRAVPRIDFGMYALDVVDVMSQFLLPGMLPVWLRGGVLGVLCAVWVYLCLPDRVDSLQRTVLRWLGGFIVAYIAVLLLLSTRTYIDRPDFRLLSPVYPAFLVGFLLLADCFVQGLGHVSERAPRLHFVSLAQACIRLDYAVIVLLLGLLAFSGQRAYSWASRAWHVGIGMYTNAEWATDPVVALMRQGEFPGQLFSNAPDALYINSGRRIAMLPYRSRVDYSGEIMPTIHALLDVEENSPIYVIWREAFWRAYTLGLDEIVGLPGAIVDLQYPGYVIIWFNNE